MAIEDACRAYGLGYAILRYFNVAGASADGLLGELHEPETHLIPRVLSAASSGSPVVIFGDDYATQDGTCLRDYVHVEDLVAAHALALDAIEPGIGAIYNLGSETGFSVREVIDACERACGHPIARVVHPRRAGDPPYLVANSSAIRMALGWTPRYPDLSTIVEHAWAWERKRAQASATAGLP
jgi:UDP-glucose 4-epimerase